MRLKISRLSWKKPALKSNLSNFSLILKREVETLLFFLCNKFWVLKTHFGCVMINRLKKFLHYIPERAASMERITSLQNPLVKSLVKLNTAAARKTENMFLLEGIKLCREAFENGLDIRYCLCGENEQALELAARCTNAQCFLVSDAIISKISTAKTPQKIIMAAVMPKYMAEDISGDIVLALDGVSDPANFGSMLRTAEAFGVRDILCSGQTVDLYSSKVLRGAMGSSFRVRVHRGDLKLYLTELKSKGYFLYATALTGNDILLQQADFSKKCVVVIGNEGNGVSEEILGLCDQTVMIPMVGKNESLNAAAAAAVVLWQSFSARGFDV